MPKTNYFRTGEDIQCDKVINWIKRQAKNKELADMIGISEQLMSYKLKNRTIKTEELILIFHELHTEPSEVGKLLTY